jgi:hypothetical protein
VEKFIYAERLFLNADFVPCNRMPEHINTERVRLRVMDINLEEAEKKYKEVKDDLERLKAGNIYEDDGFWEFCRQSKKSDFLETNDAILEAFKDEKVKGCFTNPDNMESIAELVRGAEGDKRNVTKKDLRFLNVDDKTKDGILKALNNPEMRGFILRNTIIVEGKNIPSPYLTQFFDILPNLNLLKGLEMGRRFTENIEKYARLVQDKINTIEQLKENSRKRQGQLELEQREKERLRREQELREKQEQLDKNQESWQQTQSQREQERGRFGRVFGGYKGGRDEPPRSSIEMREDLGRKHFSQSDHMCSVLHPGVMGQGLRQSPTQGAPTPASHAVGVVRGSSGAVFSQVGVVVPASPQAVRAQVPVAGRTLGRRPEVLFLQGGTQPPLPSQSQGAQEKQGAPGQGGSVLPVLSGAGSNKPEQTQQGQLRAVDRASQPPGGGVSRSGIEVAARLAQRSRLGGYCGRG